MNREIWNSLTFFEQLSNIDGEVRRLVRAHTDFLENRSDKDHAYFYLQKIKMMIEMIAFDPKNASKAYCVIEFMDEMDEIRHYLNGERDADYILRYWRQYTDAISTYPG